MLELMRQFNIFPHIRIPFLFPKRFNVWVVLLSQSRPSSPAFHFLPEYNLHEMELWLFIIIIMMTIIIIAIIYPYFTAIYLTNMWMNARMRAHTQAGLVTASNAIQ